MTHSYTLRFRILRSKPVLFLTTRTRIHSRTPSGPWNTKSHSISSTPKHSHTNISEKPTMRELCNVDVLIVGAGPAGLMMASSLVRSGVSFRIIERRYAYDKLTLPHSSHSILFFGSNLSVRSALQQAGHGDGLQPRTMEVLQVRVLQTLFLCPFLTCSPIYSASDSCSFVQSHVEADIWASWPSPRRREPHAYGSTSIPPAR